MDTIDRYAHSNAIRCLDPAQKGALALLAMGLCLLIDHLLTSLLTIGWMLALTVLWARVPARVFLRVILAQSIFLAVSSVGVAISIGIGPAVPDSWALCVGSLSIGTRPAALTLAFLLIARATGCVSGLNFLILTTPLVDLIELMRRLRAPEVLIDLMTLTYRAIFVLLESFQRIRVAQDARLGYSHPRQAMRSAALLVSRLFLDTYRRSLRLQLSLESRGMEGALRVLPMTYTRTFSPWWLGLAMVFSLLLAGVAR